MAELHRHSEAIAKTGSLPKSGKWLAEYHFNSALWRVDVVFERVLDLFGKGADKMRLAIVPILLALLVSSTLVQAAEYRCMVEAKFNSDYVYSESEIQKQQFSVLVEERGSSAFLSRCSFINRLQKVTCDRYEVDKTVFDENVTIKKFYVFRSQFDVQIFADLSFIENNGRGGIAFGKCNTVAP